MLSVFFHEIFRFNLHTINNRDIQRDIYDVIKEYKHDQRSKLDCFIMQAVRNSNTIQVICKNVT